MNAAPVRVRCEWGLQGVRKLRDEVAALVIVDVLSFSTTVDVAVGRGAVIIPHSDSSEQVLRAAATRAGAVLALPRSAGRAHYSLSPASFLGIPTGTRVLLPSPNGAALTVAAGTVPVLTSCLRNARAVAEAARDLAGRGSVGVIPAGEHWPDGSLRPAIEDWLGAGALISALGSEFSAEAQVARDAFRSALPCLPDIVRGSVSGLQLIAWGFSDDVEIALQVGVSDAVPILRNGAYMSA